VRLGKAEGGEGGGGLMCTHVSVLRGEWVMRCALTMGDGGGVVVMVQGRGRVLAGVWWMGWPRHLALPCQTSLVGGAGKGLGFLACQDATAGAGCRQGRGWRCRRYMQWACMRRGSRGRPARPWQPEGLKRMPHAPQLRASAGQQQRGRNAPGLAAGSIKPLLTEMLLI
jgi:hypothetical protein